ncbi:fibronectin type III domain-containing protein [Patescibacteria group bacterium]|nr:fibronectin type III domain-containing protein [Patescibacteria group bacterium]
MKIVSRLLIIIFILSTVAIPSVSADRSEKAKVIKFDKIHHDLIVERQDGKRWLIQHNRVCGSMNTEFPVTLVTDNEGNVKQLKVAANEICTVYNAVPYSGEGKVTKLIRSENLIVRDHEAELVWYNKKYFIDYDSARCPFLRDYLNERIYLYLPEDELKGGYIVLPGNRGQCRINFVRELETLEADEGEVSLKLNVDSQNQNNQVYFYWDEPQSDERLLYLISYSRYRLNLADYDYWEMPNLKRTREHSYTITALENGRTYYFYVAALNESRQVSEWTEIVGEPVGTGGFKNNPDPDTFEIEMEEADDGFRLYWPRRDDAYKYWVYFYVNGRENFFKYLPADENEIIIPKNPEYLNKRLRLTVRVTPLESHNLVYYDGHFWSYKEQ